MFFGVWLVGLFWGVFLRGKGMNFYEIRIPLSFSSESSLRENMAGGGGSSAQYMQTSVGGLLLLTCKVG